MEIQGVDNLSHDSPLKKKIHALHFKKDASGFFIKNNILYCTSVNIEFINQDASDIFVNKVKLILKKYPKFFSAIYNTMGASFVGKNAKNAISTIREEAVIFNLGSGAKRVRQDVINIDFYPFKNVDMVADIADLPFSDNSVDAIINEFVLEHVSHPEKIVSEMFRVLKHGGILYIAVPFLASFHSSPNDFYRWTRQGLLVLLKDFKEIESGVRCGPTSAMAYVISEWLGTLLSFGIKTLQQILFIFFMILFSPLKILDYIISKLPSSENIAYGFYFIGTKK